MSKIKLAAATTLLLAFGIAARPAAADVLDNVPADAMVALKVANLTQTSDKVAKLAKQYGIDAFAPKAQNPLQSFKQSLHAEKGFNDAGEMALVFTSPKAYGVTADQSMLILLPVSNYNDFISNYADAKTEGGVTEAHIEENDQKPTYIADWGGGYAALSPTKALIAKPAGTLKIKGLSAREAGKQDFLIYANFAKISPELLPELQKLTGKANAEIDKNPEIDSKYKPLAKVVAAQLIEAARTFLDNVDTATIGSNITDAGINTTVLSDFKPDSYLGKFAGSLKNTEGPLTNGLPATKYFAFAGGAVDSAPVMKVIDDVLQPIIPELNKVVDPATVSKLLASLHASQQAIKGFAMGMPAPAKVGQEALIQQFIVYRNGGEATKTLFDQGTDVAQQAVADMKVPEGKPQPTFEKKAADKNIEGVTFDYFTFAMKPAADDPQGPQMTQMMNMMYGGDGPQYHYGVLNKDFLMAVSMPDATIGNFVKSVKSNDEAVAKLDQVKAVAAELPKSRIIEYYVSIDEIVNTGVQTAGQFGFPVQVQLPPELPPFGFTFGTEGNAFRIDGHIPTTTVQALISAGLQVFGQFNGGGGNL